MRETTSEVGGASRLRGPKNSGEEVHWYDCMAGDSAPGSASEWAAGPKPALSKPPATSRPVKKDTPQAPAGKPFASRLAEICSPGALIVVLLALLGVALLFPYSRGLWQLVRQDSAPRYLASSDFNLDAFRSLRPGMTEQEVRDTVGIPCKRFAVHTVRWSYTAPIDATQRTPFLLCSVIFDKETKRVMQFVEREQPATNFQDPGLNHWMQQVGDLSLQDENGSKKVLRTNDPAPHLLLIVSDSVNAARNALDARKRQREFRKAGHSALVVTPSAGGMTETAPQLKQLTSLREGDWPYRLYLYRHGELRLVNSAASVLFPDESRADEEWQLRQLG